MSNIKTNLESAEKEEKFPIGPTSSKPGPILFNVVITEVTVVTVSLFYKLISKMDNIIIIK